MEEIIRRIHWQKVLVAAVAYLIIAFILRQIEVVLTMDYYKNPEFFGVWSKLMMPTAGPPPASFLVTSLVFTYLTGLTLAALYEFLKPILPKDVKTRFYVYTKVVIVLATVLFTLPVLLLFNIPFSLLFVWFITALVTIMCSTVAFIWILK